MRMTRSGSTFWRISGAATAVTLVNFSIAGSWAPPRLKLANIRNRTLDRRGGGHGRAGEVGAGAGTLATDEVAVGGRYAALPRRHALAVGGDAHRAAGFAPFEAGVLEDAIEPLGLGLALHALRARHDPGIDVRRFLPALGYGRGGAQVGDAA